MSAQSQILVSGCSFVDRAVWPQLLYPGHIVTNLGVAGAGNRYIADSVVDAVSKQQFDQVFVMFSGVKRQEIVSSADSNLALNPRTRNLCHPVGSNVYFFSGEDRWSQQLVNDYQHIRDHTWPQVKSISDLLQLPAGIWHECVRQDILHDSDPDGFYEEAGYRMALDCLLECAFLINYTDQQDSAMSERTYNSMLYCCLVLERLGIDYRFGFFYNPFDANYKSLGLLDRQSSLYRLLDWSRFVPVYPIEIALRHPEFSVDGFHLNQLGQEQFAKQLTAAGVGC